MTMTESPAVTPADTDESIRPFRVEVPEADVEDLRRRLLATRLPDRETVSDATQGVQLEVLTRVLEKWTGDWDWRVVEEKLNSYPQFVTTIDGIDIHFIHVRSRNANALPMIVTHGWPGSVIEQLKIIEPLTDPASDGGDTADSFDLVIPSLPGHGFSGKPTETGWEPVRIARIWIELMRRLGYQRYVAQGGDWGNAITEQMALLEPEGLVGIHTNMAATVPDSIQTALNAGEDAPADLTVDERGAWDQLADFYAHGLAYAQEMGNRPQTLAGLADSPIGLAAWMLDHDARSYELIARTFAGAPEGITPNDVLDNIALYWFTNTAVSSARLYWESKLPFFAPKGVRIPAAVSVFPDEIYAAPQTWAERAYPNLIHFNRLERGGHFAAWEQPELFSQELREAFRSLR